MHLGYLILAVIVLFFIAMIWAVIRATQWELINQEWDHSAHPEWEDSDFQEN